MPEFSAMRVGVIKRRKSAIGCERTPWRPWVARDCWSVAARLARW